MRTLWMIGLLISISGFAGATDPVETWKLPDVEGKEWVARVKKVVDRAGWTVEVRGNVIVVRRDKVARMARYLANSIDGRPVAAGEDTISFELRFAPKMSMDDYERFTAINTESDKEHDRLKQLVKVTHKFDQFVPSTAEERERVRVYREAVAKLPRHNLPTLYAPDHSIHVADLPSGSFPADKEVAAESLSVREAINRYFGHYKP